MEKTENLFTDRKLCISLTTVIPGKLGAFANCSKKPYKKHRKTPILLRFFAVKSLSVGVKKARGGEPTSSPNPPGSRPNVHKIKPDKNWRVSTPYRPSPMPNDPPPFAHLKSAHLKYATC
ncbi:hypothetical protein [Mucilaginibacter psychrotolerans]|uniref:Uncharacterized protein n=1 Tax=Mucilaginibacter psychrotolerans TaxID=1524096 RepID=A0A4Y8S857_9SPHI|nr:hypothetical protein [Mucilaginibacter psychrotolerans]TFF35233.1 hypothetical protein E2R66_19920 [Mucilaginibacter psychrotolerans]